MKRSGAAEGAILIVDDAAAFAGALEIACAELLGYSVRLAGSGADAMRMLSDDVRAVVTDISMPAMDGFELIRRIRGDARYSRVPIIVVSADTDPRTPERVYRLGANAYFSKPCSPASVRQKLEELLDETEREE